LLAMLCDMLEEAGYTPIAGELNRGAAMKQIRLATYDVVVTDLQMPNFNGVDVLDWVSEYKKPVVALTGASTSQLKSMGCDPTRYAAFMFKPANLEQMLNVVTRLADPAAPSAS
jgi:DNA-binding NtrC family response regulator